MNIDRRIKEAIAHYWGTRASQGNRQRKSGSADQGARSDVTGGKQMSMFEDLARDIAIAAGIPESAIFNQSNLELPGYYRPEKKWDFLVVWEENLVCAIEFKSQVGPSFGNNFNNRTEEAIGTATDLWVAFREGAFGQKQRPFLGYLFLLESCEGSLKPVKVKEPHFEVFPDFKDASYADRYARFLTKLKLERVYDSVALVLSRRNSSEYTSQEHLVPKHLFLEMDSYFRGIVQKRGSRK